MQAIAKEYGYNLVIHGSMAHDLDLIAVPWVDDPRPEEELIARLGLEISGKNTPVSVIREVYMYKELPGGRHSYVINLNRGGYGRNENGDIDPTAFTPDPEWYIDISVTPLGQ